MIVWLASYQKSGNTLLRSMLASYFFSSDGVFNFDLIKNIKQFPDINLFKDSDINTDDEDEVIKNYIKVQKKISKKNSLQFLKTHSYLFNFYNKYPFTNLENSLGVIYIVRDPRNVVTSFANFQNLTVENAANIMINQIFMGGDKNSKRASDQIKVWTGNWSNHYNSWKSFKENKKYLLIKYEDLINKKETTFLNVLKFIHKLKNIKFLINQKKFTNVLTSTSFENMKKLETEKGFAEASINEMTKKKIRFFDLGHKRDWNNTLDLEIKKKLENSFRKEMIELGYL
tara:strand:- start:633 stop:1490 length:858 start_codon:yes stop_codon:yes gene_type:complete